MGERNATVVAGLGNPLMTDEGVGLHIVNEMMAGSEVFSGVDFIEAGSSLMSVVHTIAGRRKVILVDCACMGEPPGTIRCFSPDEVISTKAMPNFSLHEGDLLDALKLSQKLGEYPEEVVVFGIEPESIAPGRELSSALQERLPGYIDIIRAELNGSFIHRA